MVLDEGIWVWRAVLASELGAKLSPIVEIRTPTSPSRHSALWTALVVGVRVF